MSVRLHPDAAAELDDAALWYEQEQSGLGGAFLSEVSRAIATIEGAPAAWTLFRKSRRIRRFLLTRFPYALLYRADVDAIVIVAVAHTKRLPGYWRARRLP